VEELTPDIGTHRRTPPKLTKGDFFHDAPRAWKNNAGDWTSKIAPPIIYGIQINTHIRERGGNNAGNYFENKQNTSSP
jgi:hypothetical protein